jgi:hypothetical protein
MKTSVGGNQYITTPGSMILSSADLLPSRTTVRPSSKFKEHHELGRNPASADGVGFRPTIAHHFIAPA